MTSSPKWNLSLDQLMPLMKERLAAGQTVRFSPRGVSMLPMLRQGRDSVELSPLPEGRLKKFDLPFYQRDNGSYVLHRIVKVGEHYTCIGDNQFEREYPVRHDQLIAIVSAYYRDDKRIEVTALRYRLYCRIRHLTRPVRYVFSALKLRLKRLFK